MKRQIKYVELKIDGVQGIGRISRVEFSKTWRTLYYDGRSLAQMGGNALKANYFDIETDEEFWISNPRQDGCDSLYPATIKVDEDARKEYWVEINKSPGRTKKEREKMEKAVRRRDMDRRFRAPRGGND